MADALPSTTTSEQDRRSAGRRDEETLKTAGQRHVNLIWERTQQAIAVFVVGITTTTAAVIVLKSGSSPESKSAAITFLFSMASMVIGFYFGRTNHQRIGGVGGDEVGR